MQMEIWFEREGTRLFAVEQGAGRPIVFFHGGLADHRAALMIVQSLADRFRVIAPDLRGAGRSHFGGELGWDAFADDTCALLDALNLERAIIGGTSMGSGAAIRFALRCPQRCAALVLVSPLYVGNQRGLDDAPRRAMERMHEVAQRAPSEGLAVVEPLFASLPPSIRERALKMLASFDSHSVAATTRFLASGVQPFDDLTQLTRLTMPTLIIPGIDPQHPRAVAEAYAATLPNCRLYEQSAAVTQHIAGFCEELS